MDSGRALNHRAPRGGDHVFMETLRTIADWAWKESWNRAFWPSLALMVVASLDQCTRGPSLTAMALTYFCS
jgi:hypothetical protein